MAMPDVVLPREIHRLNVAVMRLGLAFLTRLQARRSGPA